MDGNLKKSMNDERRRGLASNAKKLFWIQALANVKMFNIVSTLFFVARGFSFSMLFYTGIVWAVANLLFEVPSSYLADKWGRKRTIILAVMVWIASGVVWAIAREPVPLLCGFFLNGLGYALMSGTDEALLYDSERELGQESNTLKKLGHYESADRLFKIVTPLIGALLAQQLLEWQYVLVLSIDIVAMIVAVIVATRLVEPHHFMDLETLEAGTFHDAVKLIRADRFLTKAMFGRALLFIAGFLIWRVHQQVAISHGASLLVLGVMWSIYQTSLFFAARNLSSFLPSRSVTDRLVFIQRAYLIMRILFVLAWFFIPNIYALIFVFMVTDFLVPFSLPLYAEFFHKRSHSHNRATTVSLCNFVKSLMDIPLLLIASALVAHNVMWLFVFSAILALFVVIFLRLPSNLSKGSFDCLSYKNMLR